MQRAHSSRPSTPSTPVSPKPAPLPAPRVRKLGTLPAVTTAFGGSFTP